MTTRITLAILLTTWVVLIVGETAAFLQARQSLLALLDDTIITRATQRVAAHFGPGATEKAVNLPVGDQFVIQSESGAVLAESKGDESTRLRPTMFRNEFETGLDGKRVRTIGLRMIVEQDGRRIPVTIVYSRPAEKFDRLLSHLAGVLLLISLACGLATAWVALKMSRAALRPLRETAEVIAEVDERNLSRRISAERMPVELTAMAQRLNEMLARLESVFRQRKQFLADAAHELRTPTAALLTTLEVSLRRPRDQAALMETLNSGLADARRLRNLVEQLMEHARSEHVRGPHAMQPTDLPALVRECVDVVAPLAREKDVAITHHLPDALEFVTQRDRVRSIVLNLLSNAIEYNAPGGTVRLELARDDAGTLKLNISDTGRGIDAEQLPHVFEPFFRGGKGGSRGDDPSHLGLGLFLVRSHVDALGGTCEIDSRLGEGTTLRITLPEPPPAVAATPAEKPPAAQSVASAAK